MDNMMLQQYINMCKEPLHENLGNSDLDRGGGRKEEEKEQAKEGTEEWQQGRGQEE
jgi:hypothetical protein